MYIYIYTRTYIPFGMYRSQEVPVNISIFTYRCILRLESICIQFSTKKNTSIYRQTQPGRKTYKEMDRQTNIRTKTDDR